MQASRALSFGGWPPQLLTPLLSYVAFLLLYRFIPNTKVTLSDVWLVALGAAIAFEGAKWGFVWYVQTFPVYNVVYGAIGGGDGILDLGLCVGYHITVRGPGILAVRSLCQGGSRGEGARPGLGWAFAGQA